jgi:hypothetical protein
MEEQLNNDQKELQRERGAFEAKKERLLKQKHDHELENDKLKATQFILKGKQLEAHDELRNLKHQMSKYQLDAESAVARAQLYEERASESEERLMKRIGNLENEIESLEHTN